MVYIDTLDILHGKNQVWLAIDRHKRIILE